MTDKVQKIREEVVRMHSLLPVTDGDNISVNYADRICTTLEMYIDSLQEEPVSKDLDVAAQEYVTKEGYLAGLHYNSMVRSFKAGAEWYASHNTKLPNNLLLAARKASIDMCNIDDKYLDEYPYNPIAEQKFIEGSQWQKEQDQSTIELAEDHAMFAGMEKMKEQMMERAVEVTVHIDAGGYPYTPEIELYDYDKDVPLAKEGDKYKVVLIKED